MCEVSIFSANSKEENKWAYFLKCRTVPLNSVSLVFLSDEKEKQDGHKVKIGVKNSMSQEYSMNTNFVTFG